MKTKLYILTFFMLLSGVAFGQKSHSYQFAFKLYYNGKAVDFETFCKDYKYANVYGDLIDICNVNNAHLGYNEEDSIFYVHISSMTYIFSFALYHNNEVMTLFFPFEIRPPHYYYVDSLEFKKGDFYFDFRKEILPQADNINNRYKKVVKLNYQQLKEAFINSDYLGREKIYMSTEIKKNEN